MNFEKTLFTQNQFIWEKNTLQLENRLFLRNIIFCILLLSFVAFLSYFDIKIFPTPEKIPFFKKIYNLSEKNSFAFISNGMYLIPIMTLLIGIKQSGYRRIVAGIGNFSNPWKGIAFDYLIGIPLIIFFFAFFYYLPIDINSQRLLGQKVIYLSLFNFFGTFIFFGIILIFLSTALWMLVLLVTLPLNLLFSESNT